MTDPTASEVVIEHAADAIVAVGPDGQTVTVWNPAAERMFGWRPGEIVGRPLATIADPRSEAERDLVMERLRNGESPSLVTRRRRKDGTELDVQINYSAIVDEAGRFGGAMGIITDVTARRAEEQAQAERAWLVDRLNEMTRELSADLELSAVLGRIARSACDLVDGAASGVVLVDERGPVIAAVHGLPDKLVGYRYRPGEGAIWDVLETRAPVIVGRIEDYSRRPPELESAAAGLQSAVVVPAMVRGEVVGMLSVSFPDSDRTVSEAGIEVLGLLAGHAGAALGNAAAFGEVVRRRAREQAVIDALADGVIVVDAAQWVSGWNRAAADMTGIATAKAIGRPVPFRYSADGAREELQFGDRWVEIAATRLAASGETVLSLHDITDHKALEEAKSLFLATTSHELKTPLTVISGFAATLRYRWHQLDDNQRIEALEAITRRSETLLRLIERLLISSQADVGNLYVLTEPVDLGAALREAVAGLDAVSEHRIVVQVPETDPPVTVLADPRALEQIVGQLLENAFKYSPPGSEVRLEIVLKEGFAVVRVVDEGPGIPPEQAERIFDRFYQARADGQDRGATTGGVGLGLFIVRRIVEAQGGTVHAGPGSDGRGAAMEFTLPLVR